MSNPNTVPTKENRCRKPKSKQTGNPHSRSELTSTFLCRRRRRWSTMGSDDRWCYLNVDLKTLTFSSFFFALFGPRSERTMLWRHSIFGFNHQKWLAGSPRVSEWKFISVDATSFVSQGLRNRGSLTKTRTQWTKMQTNSNSNSVVFQHPVQFAHSSLCVPSPSLS